VEEEVEPVVGAVLEVEEEAAAADFSETMAHQPKSLVRKNGNQASVVAWTAYSIVMIISLANRLLFFLDNRVRRGDA
jgi:hypothetical protein